MSLWGLPNLQCNEWGGTLRLLTGAKTRL